MKGCLKCIGFGNIFKKKLQKKKKKNLFFDSFLYYQLK